jgi:peptidoglycan/LPS O-acetylase OafA/YrhL
MRYIKQLDSIRAIAIFFVLCNHWLPEKSALYKASTLISAPDVFFTISGFLITAILFKERIKAEVLGNGKVQVFKQFFFKRVLRIFPAYYLTILVTYIIKPDSIPDYTCYLTFTANFYMYYKEYWGYLTHLWSMSVEQQFYLFWPFVALLIPKKFLPCTIILFIITGICSQRFIPDIGFTSMLPQTCFDTLGLGALLAWVVIFKIDLLPIVYKGLLGLAIISIIIIITQTVWEELYFLSHRTLVAIIVTWLIAYFVLYGSEANKFPASIFNNKGLILIGKISYGIYLYHLTLFFYSPKILYPLRRYIPLPYIIKENFYFFLFENLGILFFLAWISWRFFELPIANFKKRYKNKALIWE